MKQKAEASIIHINIWRKGRKKVTLISGIEKDIDYKKILKYLKKHLATAGKINTDKVTKEPLILLFGDHREEMREFLHF